MWADICTVQLFQQNEKSQIKTLTKLATCALNIRERAVAVGALDEYHPNRANGYMNLGVVVCREDPRKAILLHRKALRIRKGSTKYAKVQIHGLALNYLNLGRCLWMIGELEQAAACFERCLAILKDREDMLGVRFPL